jgi:pimeloyl-ACP methyl ester carboxylesterase
MSAQQAPSHVFLGRRLPPPFLDEQGAVLDGSISEKVHVHINGVRQGMVVRGVDRANPVLLVVHGGPGMPEYFLNQSHPTDLYDVFTVVWWDQRGTARSYSPDIPRETMTVEQFVDDTIAVSDHLRRRFRQDKVYLLGHSWGSFIGIRAAAKAPERFHAYIGMAQITDQLQSEKLAYDVMLAEYARRGDRRMVDALQRAPVTLDGGTPRGYLKLRDRAMHRIGVGTTHDMRSVIRGIFLASLRFPEYTAREKLNVWRGRLFSRSFGLWEEVLRTDVAQEVPRLDVPAFFFHGVHDHTCSYLLAKRYFHVLEAPRKRFYAFGESAHSPLFEEPQLARRILENDVLAHITTPGEPGVRACPGADDA